MASSLLFSFSSAAGASIFSIVQKCVSKSGLKCIYTELVIMRLIYCTKTLMHAEASGRIITSSQSLKAVYRQSFFFFQDGDLKLERNMTTCFLVDTCTLPVHSAQRHGCHYKQFCLAIFYDIIHSCSITEMRVLHHHYHLIYNKNPTLILI